MKLIYESYRKGILFEEEFVPQTVGSLVKTLEAHILANSDRLKRICNAVVKAFETFAEEFPDKVEELSEITSKITELFTEIAENGLRAVLKALGKRKVIEYLRTIATNSLIKQFLAKKLGPKVLKFVVEEMMPAAKLIISTGKTIMSLFRVGKAVKDAIESGTGDPNKAFAMIVQDVMTAEDNKDTTAGFMKMLNIDDQWSKMLDNKVEMEFIQQSIEYIRTVDPDTTLDKIDLNKRLIEFLKQKFDGRTLARQ